jgi:hypothetical protein
MIALAIVIQTLALAAPERGHALTEGSKALGDFRPAEALALLEQAEQEGPYDHESFVKLHEQLAIAYAYLGKTEESEKSFAFMLALDPGRSISYTLSPKVTFPFERARAAVQKVGAPAIDIRWPSELSVGDKLPLDIEVVADPNAFLVGATLFSRMKGEASWRTTDLVLPKVGTTKRVWLTTDDPGHASSMELYLIARDEKGDEVYAWSSDLRPREIELGWEPPEHWYGKWWFWTIVAGVVVAGTAGGVLAAKHEPNRTVDGSLRVQ